MPTITPLTVDQTRIMLGAPSGSRPRIYGELSDGYRVKLHSIYYLDQYAPTLVRIWTTDATSIADTITKR